MNFEEMTKEELVKYIKELNEEQNGKYGLIYDREREPEQIVVDCDKYIPVLKEVKEKNINNGGQENILIEGDNFHSLSVLNYTHKEKIDVIYIDPPYNTGNKDFTYNDKFIDFEDGYRHSKWLNFMEKRLKISKNLLKEEGLIFISIDDNELYQLKLLGDKIFGENNFIGNIVVESGEVFGTKAAHVGKTFVKVKDYVLVYSKNIYSDNLEKMPLVDEMREPFDSHFGTVINEDMTTNTIVSFLQSNKEVKEMFERYGLNISKNNINILMQIDDSFKNYMYKDLSKKLYADAPYSRKIPYEVLDKYNNNEPFKYEGKLLFKTSNESLRMYIRFYDNLKHSDDYISKFTRCTYRGDLWKGFHFDMRNIDDEGGVKFKNGKKPVRLIKQLIKWANNKNAIILDFFAGSGSTGHAVLDLNNEDGGNRKFILCTNNESNICEEITYPRLNNVINGYGNKEALGGTLKYFKTDFVDNVGTRDQLYYDLTEKCIPMLCVKEETFDQVELNEEYAVYTNKEKSKYTFVYFDIFGNNYNDFKEMLEKIDEEKALYIFTLGDYVNTDDLKNVKNYTIEAIPYRILDLYKKVIKMSKED